LFANFVGIPRSSFQVAFVVGCNQKRQSSGTPELQLDILSSSSYDSSTVATQLVNGINNGQVTNSLLNTSSPAGVTATGAPLSAANTLILGMWTILLGIVLILLML